MQGTGLGSIAKKLSPSGLAATFRGQSEDVLLLDWVDYGQVKRNWGDAIAPIIAARLSGMKIVNQRRVFNVRSKPVYSGIGSMLGTVQARRYVVWGTGFVSADARVRSRDLDVRAVRGPLTHEKLEEQGHHCPAIYGDPALLFPRFYRARSSEHRYRLGLLPHWRDADLPCVERFRGLPDVKIIDIRGGTEQVVDDIVSCERVASSSLHGLVAADAYGVPAVWVMLSDRPAGGGFKFRDYLASTQSRNRAPLRLNEKTSYEEVYDQFGERPQLPDLDVFLEACPFLDRSRVRADGSID